jgi:hypothetical protein
MHSLRDLRLRLDPWQTEGGGETPVATPLADDGEAADLGVERAPDAWSPIAPGKVILPPTRARVVRDDMRRCEERFARVLGEVPGDAEQVAAAHAGEARTSDAYSAAILALGAANRTVGVVTHVAELVPHMPERIEVRKEPGGSRVFVRT